MTSVSRRDFLELATTTTAMGMAAPSLPRLRPRATAGTIAANQAVHLSGDGAGLSPPEFAALLNDLCQKSNVVPDEYCLGGEVERFERSCAELLGKETAVFMPTGTLANQLAVRALAKDRRRVLVQEMSHMYNDTGDACQVLSGLNLVPLAPGKATFTTADVQKVIERTASGRVAAQVGAIAIESPVRRLAGEMFDYEEMKRVAALAKERGIGLHLDGARLFIASAYSGITPAQYAALFDTVYVSLWKYFNSGVGAILAGPKSTLDGMFHVRRMFGGNLWAGWPSALVAGHYMQGFLERLRLAVRVSEDFYTAVGRHAAFTVERISNGTNITRLKVRQSDLEGFRRRLEQSGILLPRPADWGGFSLGVNETWNRTTGADLTAAFGRALA